MTRRRTASPQLSVGGITGTIREAYEVHRWFPPGQHEGIVLISVSGVGYGEECFHHIETTEAFKDFLELGVVHEGSNAQKREMNRDT